MKNKKSKALRGSPNGVSVFSISVYYINWYLSILCKFIRRGRCLHRPCGIICVFPFGFGKFVTFFLRADVGIGPYNKIYLIDKL